MKILEITHFIGKIKQILKILIIKIEIKVKLKKINNHHFIQKTNQET